LDKLGSAWFPVFVSTGTPASHTNAKAGSGCAQNGALNMDNCLMGRSPNGDIVIACPFQPSTLPFF
jgi:hypothetical protein